MKHETFRDWVSQFSQLTAAQQQQAIQVFRQKNEAKSSLEAIELNVDEARTCPRCNSPGAVSRGRCRGLRRYQCKACGRYFNATTGTPLQGLHHKERWLKFGRCLSNQETIEESAGNCGIAASTAFRWRHRFLQAVEQTSLVLEGLVEADETYLLHSFKGQAKLRKKSGRPARQRGGKAGKRGRSGDLVPMLFAADRGGTTLCHTLGRADAQSMAGLLRSRLRSDSVLVSDANPCYAAVAKELGVMHEMVNQSAGERVRGAIHIQTVNSRHSGFKRFLRNFNGVASSYLDSYLRWNHLLSRQGGCNSPEICLQAALNRFTRPLMRAIC